MASGKLTTIALLLSRIVRWVEVHRPRRPGSGHVNHRFFIFGHRKMVGAGRLGVETARREFLELRLVEGVAEREVKNCRTRRCQL